MRAAKKRRKMENNRSYIDFYVTKIDGLSESVTDIKRLLSEALFIIESSWSGKAASECEDKVLRVNAVLSKVAEEMNDMFGIMSGISNEP